MQSLNSSIIKIRFKTKRFLWNIAELEKLLFQKENQDCYELEIVTFAEKNSNHTVFTHCQNLESRSRPSQPKWGLSYQKKGLCMWSGNKSNVIILTTLVFEHVQGKTTENANCFCREKISSQYYFLDAKMTLQSSFILFDWVLFSIGGENGQLIWDFCVRFNSFWITKYKSKQDKINHSNVTAKPIDVPHTV